MVDNYRCVLSPDAAQRLIKEHCINRFEFGLDTPGQGYESSHTLPLCDYIYTYL